jgi:hypothetical protein
MPQAESGYGAGACALGILPLSVGDREVRDRQASRFEGRRPRNKRTDSAPAPRDEPRPDFGAGMLLRFNYHFGA